MPAAQYDILIEQGASFELQFDVRSDPTVDFPDGQAIDLTGVTVRSQIRPSADSSIVIAEFMGSVVEPAATSGIISIALPADVTQSIDTNKYTSGVYDVLISFPNALVRRIMMGEVEISPGVTR